MQRSGFSPSTNNLDNIHLVKLLVQTKHGVYGDQKYIHLPFLGLTPVCDYRNLQGLRSSGHFGDIKKAPFP